MTKKIIVISDPHCGHVAGLTPPQWQLSSFEESSTKRNKWADLQKELWMRFENLIEKYKPFDLGFDLGDIIEGKGTKSGSTELITADRSEQADMAAFVHNKIRDSSNKDFEWIGVYGTTYHVSGEGGEDWETIVAERANFKKIGSHEWVDVNGCIFDLKHHVSSSSVPYGRHTPVAKEKLWNMLWSEHGYQPNSSVILRGHVHYAAYCGQPGWVAMTLPALQGMGTKYGGRICSGLVHWGITVFEVDDNGRFDFEQAVVHIDAQKAKVIKI
jgi:hypothetical protein